MIEGGTIKKERRRLFASNRLMVTGRGCEQSASKSVEGTKYTHGMGREIATCDFFLVFVVVGRFFFALLNSNVVLECSAVGN